jgi:hypothetical protein
MGHCEYAPPARPASDDDDDDDDDDERGVSSGRLFLRRMPSSLRSDEFFEIGRGNSVRREVKARLEYDDDDDRAFAAVASVPPVVVVVVVGDDEDLARVGGGRRTRIRTRGMSWRSRIWRLIVAGRRRRWLSTPILSVVRLMSTMTPFHNNILLGKIREIHTTTIPT